MMFQLESDNGISVSGTSGSSKTTLVTRTTLKIISMANVPGYLCSALLRQGFRLCGNERV